MTQLFADTNAFATLCELEGGPGSRAALFFELKRSSGCLSENYIKGMKNKSTTLIEQINLWPDYNPMLIHDGQGDIEKHDYKHFGFGRCKDEKCVGICLYPSTHEHVEIQTIISYPDRCGHGTEILTRLCKLADEMEVILWLEALPFGEYREHIPLHKLVAWYKRFGFFHIKYPNPKWISKYHILQRSTWKCAMMRNPQWA